MNTARAKSGSTGSARVATDGRDSPGHISGPLRGSKGQKPVSSKDDDDDSEDDVIAPIRRSTNGRPAKRILPETWVTKRKATDKKKKRRRLIPKKDAVTSHSADSSANTGSAAVSPSPGTHIAPEVAMRRRRAPSEKCSGDIGQVVEILVEVRQKPETDSVRKFRMAVGLKQTVSELQNALAGACGVAPEIVSLEIGGSRLDPLKPIPGSAVTEKIKGFAYKRDEQRPKAAVVASVASAGVEAKDTPSEIHSAKTETPTPLIKNAPQTKARKETKLVTKSKPKTMKSKTIKSRLPSKRLERRVQRFGIRGPASAIPNQWSLALDMAGGLCKTRALYGDSNHCIRKLIQSGNCFHAREVSWTQVAWRHILGAVRRRNPKEKSSTLGIYELGLPEEGQFELPRALRVAFEKGRAFELHPPPTPRLIKSKKASALFERLYIFGSARDRLGWELTMLKKSLKRDFPLGSTFLFCVSPPVQPETQVPKPKGDKPRQVKTSVAYLLQEQPQFATSTPLTVAKPLTAAKPRAQMAFGKNTKTAAKSSSNSGPEQDGKNTGAVAQFQSTPNAPVASQATASLPSLEGEDIWEVDHEGTWKTAALIDQWSASKPGQRKNWFVRLVRSEGGKWVQFGETLMKKSTQVRRRRSKS